MQNPFQPNLRKLWILLCTSTLLTYTIMPVRHETIFYVDAGSSWLEALMFLLSFPLGDLVMFMLYSHEYGVMGRFALWALALSVGYAQWFHLFPALLRLKPPKPMTTLNLSAAPGVAFAPAAAAPARALPGRAPVQDAPPTTPLDDRGLTPIERVFRDEG